MKNFDGTDHGGEPTGSQSTTRDTLDLILGEPSEDKEAALRRKLLAKKAQITESVLREKLLEKRSQQQVTAQLAEAKLRKKLMGQSSDNVTHLGIGVSKKEKIPTTTDTTFPTASVKQSYDCHTDRRKRPRTQSQSELSSPQEYVDIEETIWCISESEPSTSTSHQNQMNKTDVEVRDQERSVNDDVLLSSVNLETMEQKRLIEQLPVYYPGISGCRNISEFQYLRRIEEGTFGIVYKAIELRSDEIVALKKLKLEREHDGFPITSLREINMLMKCKNHPNVVNLKEVVVGNTMDMIYLVMEYAEHDVKSLMKQLVLKKKKFTIAQIKTLMLQLLSGCEYLHDEWVIHRDLKTSNLLLTHDNILKIADFGLAREYGDPLKAYTPVVVTLWYRAPELLLGTKLYSTAVDMWSVGCIFGEFLKLTAMFPGSSDNDQLNKIFMDIGTPNETVWPGYKELPGVSKCVFANTPYNQLRQKYYIDLNSESGVELLKHFLAPCPERRISATNALKHPFFDEKPFPATLDCFPTWPTIGDVKAPSPRRLPAPKLSAEKAKLLHDLKIDEKFVPKSGFSLKTDTDSTGQPNDLGEMVAMFFRCQIPKNGKSNQTNSVARCSI